MSFSNLNPKVPARIWSQHQEAIFEAMATTRDSLLIEAVAGSGKTTTIVEAASRTKGCRGLSLAFNKRVQEELAGRLPRHFEAKTLNALGHHAWKAHIRPHSINVVKGKIFNICNEINIPSEFYSEVIALVNMARNLGIIPGADSDTELLWMESAANYDHDCTRELINYAREVLRVSIADAKKGIIDFVDQIYMPTCFDAKFSTFDIILVDEAQDLSSLQHEMLTRLFHKNSRIVAVGDTRQAIYGFRGALNNSMQRLQKTFGLRELPLTISYRCPQAVVTEARQVVSHIEASPEAPIGRVEHVKKIHLTDFQPGSAILCRNNAPLVGLAWKFIRASIPVTFLGRDLGKNLTGLLKKLAKNQIPIDVLETNLTRWASREISKNPKRESSIRDREATLRALFPGCANSRQVGQKIEKIFSQDAGGRVTLASIHTSKGFEWPTVYFLNEWLIPSQYAELDWQLEQEDNLRYVAITRAQENLFYIDSEGVE